MYKAIYAFIALMGVFSAPLAFAQPTGPIPDCDYPTEVTLESQLCKLARTLWTFDRYPAHGLSSNATAYEPNCFGCDVSKFL